MTNAFSSYRRRNQTKINTKCANMRAAKERKRIALHESEPIRPDIDDSIEITVTRHMGGVIVQQYSYLLSDEEGRGRIDQYEVWHIDENEQRHIGLMGKYKAFIEAASRCPRLRAMD